MERMSVEMESYGMNPETLRGVVEHHLKRQALELSDHLRLDEAYETLSAHQGVLGTFLTSLRLDVEAPTLASGILEPLVRLALSGVADDHRHGEYEPKPEAFRYRVVGG